MGDCLKPVLSLSLSFIVYQVLSNIHIPVDSPPEDVEEDDPRFYQPGLPVVSFRCVLLKWRETKDLGV